MRATRPLIILAASAAVVAAAVDGAAAAAAKQAAGRQPGAGPANVDVRNARGVNAAPDTAQQGEIRALRPAAVQWNRALGAPASIVRTRGYLTAASGARAEQVARGFLADHKRLYGLDDGELSTLVKGGEYRTKHNGVTQLALRQRDAGREVFGAVASFAIDKQGRLVSQSGMLAPDAAAAGQPALSAGEAVRAAADSVGATQAGPLTQRSAAGGATRRTTFDNAYAVRLGDPRPVSAELVTFPMPAGQPARLGWKIMLEVSDQADYEMVVDARGGDVLYRHNGYENAGPEGNVYRSQNPTTTQQITPFTGWVADRTTEGNNTNTYVDLDATNAVGYRPQTPASGDPGYQHFDYAFTNAYETSGGTDLTTDRDATLTQLFYWVNFSHDHLYGLGFDEASGNFQRDNFGKGGAGNDPVLAEAYNGYGDGTQKLCEDKDKNKILCRNNANFHTDPDGTSPRLQVYVGASPYPFRLSEMEGDTIVHEYSHGLSNRLVGHGTMGDGVQTDGMGEGWSDFIATSAFDDPVIFEYSGGTDGKTSGFRRVRYDTSAEKYSDVCKPSCEVHNDGEIWATALWAMRTKLIAKLDQGPGTRQAEQLVVDGMKNTGSTPTFLTARDAIIAADQTNNAGANACLIWGVFAAREMGVSASTSGDQQTVTPATDGPAACTPTAKAGGPYTTPEGSDRELDASASTPGGDGPLTYAWDLDGDGEFDDATGAKPSFTNVGRDGAFPIAVKVTNANGFSATAASSVTVTNVAPTVGTIAANTPKSENTSMTIGGTISDPGWQDPLSATIDFGDGNGASALSGTEEHARPDGTIGYEVSHTYGDDGTFTITVCARDDDVTTDVCNSRQVTVTNDAPTAAISESGFTAINGTPILVAHAGQPVAFSGRSTDPGSDDLTLRWSWGDGAPLIDVSTSYLLHPPNADPDPSPSIDPRDVTDARSHAFGKACMYDVGFSALDDDAGASATDTVSVLIAGNAARGRPTGYWAQQYRQRGGVEIDSATLTCYLRMVSVVSRVYNEAKDASTFQKAQAILFDQGTTVSKRDQLDRDLLTAWLNFANGAVDWDELVDTNRNGVVDTAFSVAMQRAETVRLAASSTPAQLDAQRAIVQSIDDTI
jgi:hypothetical protein